MQDVLLTDSYFLALLIKPVQIAIEVIYLEFPCVQVLFPIPTVVLILAGIVTIVVDQLISIVDWRGVKE